MLQDVVHARVDIDTRIVEYRATGVLTHACILTLHDGELYAFVLKK